MITGIGTDITDGRRIEKLMVRFEQRFTHKVFTPSEREYCDAQHKPYMAYAKRYAAKEAFLKALGTGLRAKISWQDIEVVHDKLGKPSINAPTLLSNQQAHLSLSDEFPYAIAYVIVEN